jgi:twitching motility protein PilT
MLFQAMLQYKASDVHLAAGERPLFRVDGQVRHSDLMPAMSGTQIGGLIETMAPAAEWKEFEQAKQCSFSFHQVGLGYARVSAFIKSGAPHVTLRFLPEQIPSFEELNIPAETMVELAKLHRGLLLVTGMTGSGKTTTAAALVDWINTHKNVHILCLENPIEYVHHNKRAMISQRGLGLDVLSFHEGVRAALRHDPDVIVIGEMRDPDTIRSAINAAATGHLVISTLHSNSASEVVNRIVSFFDPVERDLVKLQLRDCLQCVICQRLVPRKGVGRVPALEVMFNDIKAINDAILEGDTDGIRVGMQQTVGHSFLFETYLFQLLKKGEIELETAREFSTQVSMFDQLRMGTYSVPRLESIKQHH